MCMLESIWDPQGRFPEISDGRFYTKILRLSWPSERNQWESIGEINRVTNITLQNACSAHRILRISVSTATWF